MDWNTRYENEETPWDKGVATPVLTEVIGRHPELLRGRVLVPGCGAGHDARMIAALGAEVVGADIASLALEKARALDKGHTVDYRLLDVMAPPAEMLGSFDSVWEHTCLCALDPEIRRDYALGIKSMLKPDGHIAGVFFINPDMSPGETGPPFGISVDELKALWQGVGMAVVDEWVPVTGFEGRVGRELVLILAEGVHAFSD